MSQLYDCYKIINLDDFDDLELTSRKITATLGVLGQKEILVTKGNLLSFLYNGIFLSVNLNDKNPFEFEGHAIFIDPNNDVWLGIAST